MFRTNVSALRNCYSETNKYTLKNKCRLDVRVALSYEQFPWSASYFHILSFFLHVKGTLKGVALGKIVFN